MRMANGWQERERGCGSIEDGQGGICGAMFSRHDTPGQIVGCRDEGHPQPNVEGMPWRRKRSVSRTLKARSASDPTESTPLVRTFHQILLWPLQLLPLKEDSQIHHHWEFLEKDAGRVWKEVDDEFCADPDTFQERHYREFVTFLPYVQRLLYGEGAKRRSMAAYGESPIKVYRRTDVATARITLPGAGRTGRLRCPACRSLLFL